MKSTLSLCLILAGFSVSGLAAKNPWSLPDSIKVGDRELVLNGVGMRKVAWVVKVYAAGLYVPRKTSDPKAIAAMKGPKVISLYFLRDVKKEKVAKAWREAPGMDKFPQEVSVLNAYMGDMKDKTIGLEFQILSDGLMVKVNGVTKPKIANKAFADAVLGIYLGPNPLNSGLKEGMLGQG